MDMYASLTNRIRRGHSPPACTLSYRRFLLFARKGNLAGPTGNGKSLERVHTPRPATTQTVVVKRFEGFVPGIWRGAGTPLRLLACVAVASCGGGQSPPVGHTVPAGICDTIQNSYTCAQTIERVQLAGYRRAERRGSDLVLALSNGDSIVLTDVVGGADSTIRYSYRSFDPANGHHIVHAQLYEGTTFVLVHHGTGRTLFVPALPITAPGGGRFAVTSRCLVSNYCPNSIAIWSLSGDSAAPEWRFYPAGEPYPDQFHQDLWGPGDARWLSPDTLLVPVIRLEDGFLERATDSAIVILRDAATWTIAGAVPHTP